MSAVKIHNELCMVYGQNVISEGSGVECTKMVEQMFIMKSEVVSHL
jgi:hypothetical protein